MNKNQISALGNPIYDGVVQGGDLRAPLVHSVVARDTCRLLIQLQQLVHLVDAAVHRAETRNIFAHNAPPVTDPEIQYISPLVVYHKCKS